MKIVGFIMYLIGWNILGETFTLLDKVGIALITIGLIFVLEQKAKRK